MPSESAIASLMAMVATEWDVEKVLDRLSKAALELTDSRNAMFARMNDETAIIELTNGAGADWDPGARFQGMHVGEHDGEGIVAYVAAKGASFMSGNVQQEPLYRNIFKKSRSEVAVPIRDRYGRTRAVFNIESDEENKYGEQTLVLCEMIAHMAGVAIGREEILRREEALLQIGNALDQALTEEELIGKLIGVIGDVLRFQSCSVFLYDAASDLFMLRGSIGELKDQVGRVGYKSGEGLTGWVCANGLPARVDNPQSDPRWKGKVLEFPGNQIASYLGTPIIHRGQTIGAIRAVRRVCENPYQNNGFTPDDQRLLSTIAEQVATGLENIRSLQKAIRVERMAAWGEVSARSSHMIGNRVFAIRGDLNELGHLLKDSELDREALNQIHDSLGVNVVRIEEILHEFRDFVMATEIKVEQVSLNELVEQSVREVFPRRSQIKLEFELAENLPAVKADVKKVRRAITEIVENCLSFFSEGRLRVSTKLAEPALLKRVKLNGGKRFYVIEIEDQGPGVAQDQKTLIFRPFYSSRAKGMGLGLSIVKGIFEGHGGTALEEGQEGKGAKFVMLLPAADRP